MSTTWVRPLLAASMVGTAALGASTQMSPTVQSRGMDYDDLQLEDIEELDESLFLDEAAPANDDNDEWRATENWWKDPLAQFDDEQADDELAYSEEEDEVAFSELEDSYSEEESVMDDLDFEPKIKEKVQQPAAPDKAERRKIAEAEKAQKLEEKLAAKQKAEQERKAAKEAAARERAQKLAERLAAKKLAQEERSRLVRNQVGKVRNSFSAPAAVLLPVIPKVRSLITTYPPVQFLGLALLIKSLFLKSAKHTEEMADSLLSEDSDDLVESAAFLNEPKAGIPKHDGGFLDRIVQLVPSGGNRAKIPSARHLLEERDSLVLRVEKAESERDNMEREYEKTSWQLQEVQSDLTAQASTTRYLKAQLRDTEQMLERAVRAERDRAREELKRMKEAMLRVLERERQGMRDEVRRQTAELQALLKEANGGE